MRRLVPFRMGVSPLLVLVIACVCCSCENRFQHKRRATSFITKIAKRDDISGPLLTSLYAARQRALKKASSIDSVINQVLQDERSSYAPGQVPASLPYFDPKIAGGPKSVPATIGAHGGTWYSTPVDGGAGQIGANMVNIGARRNQPYQSPLRQGTMSPVQATYVPLQRKAPIISSYPSPPKAPPKPVLVTKQESASAPLVKVKPTPTGAIKEPVKDVVIGSFASLPVAPKALPKALTVPKQQSASIQHTAKPTTANITKDPGEDVEILGNPRSFDRTCAVLKLTFERSKGEKVMDDTVQQNNARLMDGATVTNQDTRSGHSANLGEDGKIALAGEFKGKPKKAVAISMWVKLKDVKGNHSLFRATDLNNIVHYDLGVHDGKGSWVHHDDSGKELFRVESRSSDIKPGEWHNIVGEYNSIQGAASLWVDGRRVSQKNGISGPLSQKWNALVVFGGKTAGLLDNIFMFRCPLDRTKIVALYVAAAARNEADSEGSNPRKPLNK